MKKSWHTDPIIFCVFASWATAFVLIKIALGEEGGFTPLAFLWPRMFLSAIILFALLPIIRASTRLSRADLLKTAVIGVVGLGSYHLLFTVGLSMTTPVDTALIIATGPVMTALWMPLFKLQRTTARGWLGVVICFVTVAVISISGASEHPTHAGWDTGRLLGDIMMLVAANCWALNGILCRKAPPHLKSSTITAYGMLWASAALLPVCALALFRQDWTAVTPKGWWCFAYAILPASTISVVFFYYGVKKVGPLHTIIYQNFSPVITAVLMYLMFAEPPSIVQVVGVFAIFLGVYLTRTSKGKADVSREAA